MSERRPVDDLPFTELSTYLYGRQLPLEHQMFLFSFFKEHSAFIQQFVTSINYSEPIDPDVQWNMDAGLAETARLRYGYVEQEHGSTSVDVDPDQFKICLRKMYEVKSLAETGLSSSIRKNIVELVMAIENSKGILDNLPENLFDLRERNIRYLARHASNLVRIERRECFLEENREKDKHLDKRAKSTTDVYFVHRKVQNASASWTIVLTDPVSVLECMRARATDYRSLLRHLLQRGIPFRTVQKNDQKLHWTSRQPQSLLPCRLEVSSLTPVDYIQYVNRVRSLILGNQRVCRAALMAGGILWRLVIEAASFDHVLSGPSLEQLAHVFTAQRSGDFPVFEEYFDDTLTPDEEDIICGVFRSSDEECSHVVPQWSFWPKWNVWKTSSVNAGYWTPYNETWFLERRSRLLGKERPALLEDDQRANNDSFKPLMIQKSWRLYLKGQKSGLRVSKANQALAIEFLDRILKN